MTNSHFIRACSTQIRMDDHVVFASQEIQEFQLNDYFVVGFSRKLLYY